MRLNVRLMRGREIFLRTGRLWYQKVLVGGFMRRRLPWASSSFTGSIRGWAIFPRASLCLKTKSRPAPKETEAMGQRGSSSFSSSRCSPMWSSPSLYLVENEKHLTPSARRQFPKLNFGNLFLTCWPEQSWTFVRWFLWQHPECIPVLESMDRPSVWSQNMYMLGLHLRTWPVFWVCCTLFQTLELLPPPLRQKPAQ